LTRHTSVKKNRRRGKQLRDWIKYTRQKCVLRSFLKVHKNAVLKSSVKSSGNEFQTVGAAWQKVRLPNTVLAAAMWSEWC